MRKRLHGRRFQRDYPHEVVIEPQVVAVTLERGVADVEIEKGVGAEAHAVSFRGCVVQKPTEEGERLLAAEEAWADGILQLEDEGFDLVSKLQPAAFEVVLEQNDRTRGREPL